MKPHDMRHGRAISDNAIALMAHRATYALVRLSDGKLLAGTNDKATAERLLNTLNAAGPVAEIRERLHAR